MKHKNLETISLYARKKKKKKGTEKKNVCLGREQYDQLSSLPPILVLQLELVAFLQGLRI